MAAPPPWRRQPPSAAAAAAATCSTRAGLELAPLDGAAGARVVGGEQARGVVPVGTGRAAAAGRRRGRHGGTRPRSRGEAGDGGARPEVGAQLRKNWAVPGDAAARPGDWSLRPAAASKGLVPEARRRSRRGTAVAGMAGPVRRGRDSGGRKEDGAE